MGRQEFVDATGIPKNTLIGIEVGKHKPGTEAITAIANAFPQYALYLLIDVGTR